MCGECESEECTLFLRHTNITMYISLSLFPLSLSLFDNFTSSLTNIPTNPSSPSLSHSQATHLQNTSPIASEAASTLSIAGPVIYRRDSGDVICVLSCKEEEKEAVHEWLEGVEVLVVDERGEEDEGEEREEEERGEEDANEEDPEVGDLVAMRSCV